MSIETEGGLPAALFETSRLAKQRQHLEQAAQVDEQMREWEIRDSLNWEKAKEFVRTNFNKTREELLAKLQRAAQRGEVKVVEQWLVLDRGETPAGSTEEMAKYSLMRDRLVEQFSGLGFTVDGIEEPFLVAETEQGPPTVEVGMLVGLEVGWELDTSAT